MALTKSERESLEQELTKTKTTTSSIVEAISSLNASLEVFKVRSYQTMSNIRSAADLIVNEIRSHEEHLIARVQEIIDTKEECVQQQRKLLEEYVTELQQAIDYTSDVLNGPIEPDIDLKEWKTALTCQLNQINGMKHSHKIDLEMNDQGKFLFVYANQDLLKSVANYGAIITDVPEDFIFENNGDDSSIETKMLQIIPVVTLNGAIIDLDASISDSDSEEESSDDESDSSYSNDSSNNDDDDELASDEDDQVDDERYDDDNIHSHSSRDCDTGAQLVNVNTELIPRKPRLSTLI